MPIVHLPGRNTAGPSRSDMFAIVMRRGAKEVQHIKLVVSDKRTDQALVFRTFCNGSREVEQDAAVIAEAVGAGAPNPVSAGTK